MIQINNTDDQKPTKLPLQFLVQFRSSLMHTFIPDAIITHSVVVSLELVDAYSFLVRQDSCHGFDAFLLCQTSQVDTLSSIRVSQVRHPFRVQC